MNKFRLFFHIVKKILPILKLPSNLKYNFYISRYDEDYDIIIYNETPLYEEYTFYSSKPIINEIDDVIGYTIVPETRTREKEIELKLNL